MTTRHEQVHSADVIATRLVDDLGRWKYDDGAICRTYKTKDWRATLLAAGAVAHLAEAAWHHPEMILNYPSLEIRLNTHSAGGVTDKDFELASRIEAVIGWRPGADGGALEGTPEDVGYILKD
ncbi:MAG: 4a-hydroxytetrahydrobiopterin dehydratase [Rhodoblastus sp.]|nr:4a-hydroxytetrahydrobiopterin dehydratase [Rhodoblastus sp.]